MSLHGALRPNKGAGYMYSMLYSRLKCYQRKQGQICIKILQKLNSLGLEKWQVHCSSQMALLAIHTTLGKCQNLSCSDPPEKQESDDTLNVNPALRNIVLQTIHQVIHPLWA